MVTATEKKRKVKARMNFRGREWLKSLSSNGEVRMERNITTEVNELARERTSITVKTKRKRSVKMIGIPVSWLEPPGTV